MTPELPRAPISAPRASCSATRCADGSSSSAMAVVPAFIVAAMLLPESPSGTGNTFSALMASLCSSSQACPARMARFRSCPSNTLICRWRGRVKREKKFFAISFAGGLVPRLALLMWNWQAISYAARRLPTLLKLAQRELVIAVPLKPLLVVAHTQRLHIDVDLHDAQSQRPLDRELD